MKILIFLFFIMSPLLAHAQGVLLVEYKIDTPVAGYEVRIYERDGIGEIYALKEREVSGIQKLSGLGFIRLSPSVVPNLTVKELTDLKDEIKSLKNEVVDPVDNIEILKSDVVGENFGEKYSGSLKVYADGPESTPLVLIDVQPKPKKNIDENSKNKTLPNLEKIILRNTQDSKEFYVRFLYRVFGKTNENLERATLVVPGYDNPPTILYRCSLKLRERGLVTR